MATFHPWTLEEIFKFLDTNGATVVFKDGRPSVLFPSGPDRERLEATVLPHLKARREDVVKNLYARFPVAFNSPNVQLEQTPPAARTRILAELRDRAAATNRAVWFLKRNGRPVRESEKAVVRHYKLPVKRKVVVPIDREATHACVEGDKAWTALPKVTTAAEDVACGKGGANDKKTPEFRKEYNDRYHYTPDHDD